MNKEILNKLSQARVVSFTKEGDKFVVTENCDQHFSVALTLVEFANLIGELTELMLEDQ